MIAYGSCLSLTSLTSIPRKSIHVVANGKTSVYCGAEQNSIVYTYHIFFIHSSLDELRLLPYLEGHIFASTQEDPPKAFLGPDSL